MPLFLNGHTNNSYFNYTQQHCYVLPLKTFTLARFEPGSPVPEANAMSTALHRQGIFKNV
jgi:hypothetical protein